MARSRRRRRLERVEGIAFDAILIAVAAIASEQVVQDWLFENPGALYHGLVALHVIACPALLVAGTVGYGKADQEIQQTTAGPLTWAMVFIFGASFIIPGVLGLIFDISLPEMMIAVFGPMVGFGLWMWALIVAERRKWIAPAKLGEPKPWWGVQGLALICWLYLIWLEAMLLAAAPHKGPLTQVGLPLGVLIDYLPIRVAMCYVRDASRWEIYTICASVLHLLYRLGNA